MSNCRKAVSTGLLPAVQARAQDAISAGVSSCCVLALVVYGEHRIIFSHGSLQTVILTIRFQA